MGKQGNRAASPRKSCRSTPPPIRNANSAVRLLATTHNPLFSDAWQRSRRNIAVTMLHGHHAFVVFAKALRACLCSICFSRVSFLKIAFYSKVKDGLGPMIWLCLAGVLNLILHDSPEIIIQLVYFQFMLQPWVHLLVGAALKKVKVGQQQLPVVMCAIH